MHFDRTAPRSGWKVSAGVHCEFHRLLGVAGTVLAEHGCTMKLVSRVGGNPRVLAGLFRVNILIVLIIFCYVWCFLVSKNTKPPVFTGGSCDYVLAVSAMY